MKKTVDMGLGYRQRGKGSVFCCKGVFFYRIRIDKRSKKFTLHAKTHEEAVEEAERIYNQFGILNEATTKEEIALFVGKTKGLILEKPKELELQNSFRRFTKSPNCPHCSSLQLSLKYNIWNKFCDFCKRKNLELITEITCDTLFHFRDELLKTVGSNSANKYIGIIKQILFILGIPRDSFAFVKKLPVKVNSMCYFNEEQLNDVFHAIDGDIPLKVTHQDQMKILFRILAWSGLRLKDACLLEWSSLNLASGVLQTRPFKTQHSSNEMVTIPLHPDLLYMLKKLSFDKGYSRYVLPDVAKRYSANPSCIQHDIARVINWALWPEKSDSRTRAPKAGKYGAHSFRHTFATFLLNRGVDAEIIMKLLGQKSLSVTRVSPNTMKFRFSYI